MKLNIYRRDECHKAEGLCVVIDVLRAFTTAAYVFAGGAEEITLVSTAEKAFQMHQEDSSLLLMGEIEGKPIKGFHYGNSPAEMENVSLPNRRLVQRTSAGTQGVVGCSHANQLMLASFVVADATLNYIKKLSPSHVSFIVTGDHDGDEDLALAEYLQCKLLQHEVPSAAFLSRVCMSPQGRAYADPNKVGFLYRDLELALQIDKFPFAMVVEKLNGNLVAKKVPM